MQIITIASQTGGTGKTTTAAALAHAAARKGRKVLAIDLDAQSNLSFIMKVTGPGSDLLLSGKDPTELIQHTAAGVDVIPGSQNLALEARGCASRLETALAPLKQQYDMIIIDTPTSSRELLQNALQASTGLIIPLTADAFCVKSLYYTVHTVRQIQADSNLKLVILGFIFTQHESRSNLAREFQKLIIEKAAEIGVLYLGAVRQAIVVREAAALHASLFEYAPKSKPAQDYMQIFDALNI